jgi:Amt family ammonium transporter
MTKMIKLISAPLLSLVVLMGLTSAGHAETNSISRSRVYI